MSKLSTAEIIVDKMYDNDRFSKWLGIKIESVEEGKCILSMIVTDNMLNGFDILHGGISFSLADSALAFAANSYGKVAVSLNSLVSYPLPVKVGETIRAEATEVSRSNRTGIYDVEVTNQNNDLVTSFRGTVYITNKNHFEE